MRSLFLLALLTLATVAHAVEPAERLPDPAMEARARVISAELARDIRRLVRERLSAGDTNPQAIQAVVARYGDFVLLRPPVKPETYALWFGPGAVLLLAVAGVAIWLRRRGAAPAEPAPLTQDEQTRLAALARDDDR